MATTNNNSIYGAPFDEKVSIVIPIYKVEQYLGACIESVIHQTYTNLEIILVDDGSPDDCRRIIEDYAKKDDRILPLHKENGGLSDARNYGMSYVTGHYTVFLDSDDWIVLDAVEKLMKIRQTYEADVVQAAFYYAYEDYLLFDDRFFTQSDLPALLDNQTLMKELVINDKVKNFAWGKLYKTDLIRELPFKKSVLFEDVFWAHHVMQRVKRYVILHEPLFYYRQRETSIVATYTTKNLDILEGLKQRHYFIEKRYPELTNESYKILFKTSMIHFNLLLRNRPHDPKGLYRKEIRDFIKRHKHQFEKAVSDASDLKWQFYLFLTHPYLNISYLLIKKSLRKAGLLSQQRALLKIERQKRSRGEHFNESVS